MDLPTVYVHQARLCGVAQGHGGGMGCIVGNPSTARASSQPRVGHRHAQYRCIPAGRVMSYAVEVRACAALVLFRCTATHNLQQRHANASTLAHGAHRPTLLSTSSCRVGLCQLYLFLPSERLHGFLGPICCDEPEVWSEWCSVAAFGFHQQFVSRK